MIEAVSCAVNKVDSGELASITTIDLGRPLTASSMVISEEAVVVWCAVTLVPQSAHDRSRAGGSGQSCKRLFVES